MLRLTSASVSSISEIFQVSEDDCFAALCLVPSGFAYAPPKRTTSLYQKTAADCAAVLTCCRDRHISPAAISCTFARFAPIRVAMPRCKCWSELAESVGHPLPKVLELHTLTRIHRPFENPLPPIPPPPVIRPIE